MNRLAHTITCLALLALVASESSAQPSPSASALDVVLSGQFAWTSSRPLVSVQPDRLPASPENPWVAVKDPSIMRHDGMWHLFCSLRKQQGGQGRIRIGYLSFADWNDAQTSTWHVLDLTEDYHGAPQVFYFTPHRKWYMIYQAADAARGMAYGPCYSTNEDIGDPTGWTRPAALYTVPSEKKAGLDYWVICDNSKAYLFFTTLNGQMWRAETGLAQFPNQGWNEPTLALKAEIFEASHTYKLKGLERYLSLIEAQDSGRRYYKAFISDRLDGEWTPLAATRAQPFASPVNVTSPSESWTTSYSHGELIRVGVDQALEVDPEQLQFLFQGASDDDRQGKDYGAIPWRLGILSFEHALK